ncbi:MAG TPA: N-acetyl-1-D-myo-inositol-2-amino-2-deoxy-alpha-D-glucopyranoside deacetylase [Mycobacteriales bacterium]|nr:N-acetyl-1-D-myo-inositol-2-amino-2-deoxy-alpha-D-glucopyranoside deacetylase [Mycobacteriales bacterium]
MPTSDRALLLVHAHPDDESIGTGVTMSRYAADGTRVVLVTCTRGEEGEIVVPDLAHLGVGAGLAEQRERELDDACVALGVADHRFLGGWTDSGMMGTPQNDRPDAFWQADLDEAAGRLVAVIREVRPQVVVTYDDNGAYGHPDHIQAHRVTMRAVDAAGDPAAYPEAGEPWPVSKVYATAVSKSMLAASIEAFRGSGSPGFFAGVQSVDDLPFGTDDALITTEIRGTEGDFGRKMAALRAHRSQISVDGPFFALADNVAQQAFGVEHFVLLHGERGAGVGTDSREDDLFAGL